MDDPRMSSPPKIAIYGTGQFGQYIARFACQKGWPIVAAYNRKGEKIGQDLGLLAGLDRELGIKVEDCDQADISDLDADIAVITITDQLSENIHAYRRFLGAGINVLCHGAEAYYPFGIDQSLAAEIDTLAKENSVTFTGSGIWDMSRIWAGLLVTGPCTELNGLFHRSVTDVTGAGKELMLRFGVGMEQEEFIEKFSSSYQTGASYKTIPQHVLSKLGYSVTKVDAVLEPAVFDTAVYCDLLERKLAPGTVVGNRIVVDAQTREGVTARAHIEVRLLQEDELEHMYWAVDGMPESNIRIERKDSAHATASCLFNRIPDVIAAPVGIQTVSMLGPLQHTSLVVGE